MSAVPEGHLLAAAPWAVVGVAAGDLLGGGGRRWSPPPPGFQPGGVVRREPTTGMLTFTDSHDVPSWFVVLPDCASAGPVIEALQEQITQQISHASGRPWLMGSWSGDAVAVGEAGDAKIAVIGQHALTAGELSAVAARTRKVADLDRFGRSLVGSAHLAASLGGRVRLHGTVTGLRRVFHATIGGASVAADRADVLAGLLDVAPDERWLALHLLNSPTLYPLSGEPVWRGVRGLATDHYLLLDPDGQERAIRWWAPPEPDVPMSEGAPALRDALSAAVAARVRGRDLVSADLGGLDSTSVCYLAARCGPSVVTYTADGRDPMAQDAVWARRTVRSLSNVEHHIIADDQLPMLYDGLREADDRFDEPSSVAVLRNRALFIPQQAAARGSRLHLTGFGGDELLAGSPAHLHAMLRTHPRTALRHARGFATQRPWGRRETLRQLMDNSRYRDWLARTGDLLTAPPPPPDTPSLDWGTSPRLPPWATLDAVAAVRELIRTAASTAEPLAERRGQHVELEGMRATSRMVRHMGEMADRLGLALASPYYDDRVIEAGLAVRPQDKITPWRYKPLIVEAMRGVVPAESLSRDTKDEGSHEVAVALREHRGDLLSLCEDSRLGRLGLIDAHALRKVLSGPLQPSLPFDALYQTFACEAWLRSLDRAAVPG